MEQTELDKNPKQLIIDYYDWLINQVECRTSFGDYYERSPASKKQLLFRPKPQLKIHHHNEFPNFSGENETFSDPYKDEIDYERVRSGFDYFETSRSYIKSMRNEMLDELRKSRDETLLRYENIKNDLDESASIESLKRKLFEDKYCFLIDIHGFNRLDSRGAPLRLFLVVLDFYLDKKTEKKLA